MNAADASPRTRLRIRAGMDVYNSYQNRYLGSVVRVWRGTSPAGSGARAAEKEGTIQSTPLTHEEGHVAQHAGSQGKRILGEELGPVPTIGLGNTGPMAQSAESDYATRDDDSLSDVIYFAVRPGRINLGILTPSFYVPSDAVESLSMERVVLAVEGRTIPAEWRSRPQL
ncbi:MAG TPA: hypothetical protein VF221_13240 [Chloroflexota bacterium]